LPGAAPQIRMLAAAQAANPQDSRFDGVTIPIAALAPLRFGELDVETMREILRKLLQ
jgi:hypothetical protein